MIPFECVARGYLAGSGWAEYRKSGSVCGVPLPAGLREADRLPEPIFTPAIKNDRGHDENVSFERMADEIGEQEARRLSDLTLSLYERASAHALEKGLILADTKLEFGWDEDRLLWIDEAFTPDSSRFWDAAQHSPGTRPPSLSTSSSCATGSTPPAGTTGRPPRGCPRGSSARTREKYLEAFRLLTGSPTRPGPLTPGERPRWQASSLRRCKHLARKREASERARCWHGLWIDPRRRLVGAQEGSYAQEDIEID